MLQWLRERFRSRPPAPALEAGPPAWAEEILTAGQRQSRAMTKQSLQVGSKLDEIGEKLDALSDALAEQPAPGPDDSAFEDVFDALDSLDQAIALAADPAMAEGLKRVGARLSRFCETQGYRRIDLHAQAPDPRVARVVASEASSSVSAGRVLRVVRAAVVSGQRVVREGEVIVCKGEAPEHREEAL